MREVCLEHCRHKFICRGLGGGKPKYPGCRERMEEKRDEIKGEVDAMKPETRMAERA